MRTLLTPFLLCSSLLSILPGTCLAQRGFGPRSTPVGVGGFGNVLHPGTGGPSTVGTGIRGNVGVGGAFGAGAAQFRGTNARNSRRVGYPLFISGGLYLPYTDYGSQSVPAQDPGQPAPPVIINQYFAAPNDVAPRPGIYQPATQRPADTEDDAPPQPRYYLLAFKDHSVYSALAYWVEDKTLHYVTTQNTHNQASLDLVDVDFTTKLNQDHDAPFSILTPSK